MSPGPPSATDVAGDEDATAAAVIAAGRGRTGRPGLGGVCAATAHRTDGRLRGPAESLFALPGGRLLIGSASAGWYDVDPGTGTWTRLPLPGVGRSFTVTVAGEQIYTYSSQPGTAYVRSRNGAWQPLPR